MVREKEERRMKKRARSGEENRGGMGGDDGDFLGRIKWDERGIWLDFRGHFMGIVINASR